MSEEIIIAILSSTLLSTIISNLFTIWKEKVKKGKEDDEEKKRRQKIDRLLLLSALKIQARCMISEGYRTELTTRELEKYYGAYKGEGGDGFADDIYNQAKALPMKMEATYRKNDSSSI